MVQRGVHYRSDILMSHCEALHLRLEGHIHELGVLEPEWLPEVAWRECVHVGALVTHQALVRYWLGRFDVRVVYHQGCLLFL